MRKQAKKGLIMKKEAPALKTALALAISVKYKITDSFTLQDIESVVQNHSICTDCLKK